MHSREGMPSNVIHKMLCNCIFYASQFPSITCYVDIILVMFDDKIFFPNIKTWEENNQTSNHPPPHELMGFGDESYGVLLGGI